MKARLASLLPYVLLLALLLNGSAGAVGGARPALQGEAPEAGAPSMVSYQGQVSVGGVPYNGTGYFKFAIIFITGTKSIVEGKTADLLLALTAFINVCRHRGSLICGAHVEISGPKGTIVVRIVDQCPECPEGNIDLSAEAFALIA